MVSVVLPTFNRARCIARAIDSVLDQTFTDIELIVVDDGSTDDTRELVEQYTDSRVRYVWQEHEGACAARNRGIHESRGEYIAFQDSDDEWIPEKLEKQIEHLMVSGADIVFSAFYRGEENGEIERFPPDAERKNCFISLCDIIPDNICSTQTLLFRKECLQENLFDTSLRRLQDWELMIRMVQKWKVFMLNEPLAIQYIQQDSISKIQQDFLPALVTIFREVSDSYRRQHIYVKRLERDLLDFQMIKKKKEFDDALNEITKRKNEEREGMEMEGTDNGFRLSVVGTVCFDFGEGFTSERKELFEWDAGSNTIVRRINIPKGCKALCFSPVEDAGCIIWNLVVRTESQFITATSSNGVELNNIISFRPDKPKIVFENLDDTISYIEVSANIMLMRGTEAIIFCDSMENALSSMSEWQRQLEAERQKNYELRSEYDVLAEELAKVQGERDSAKTEIQDYSNLVAYEREEAKKVASAFYVMSNSHCWKMTKPIRVVLNLLKRIGHKFKNACIKLRFSLKNAGLRGTICKIIGKLKRRQNDSLPAVASAIVAQPNCITGNPIDRIETVVVNEHVKRLNFVTDTIEASSLLGGVATALIVATEFANRFDYVLRIITRCAGVNSANYFNIVKMSGVEPAQKVSFYSDYDRNLKSVDFRMEIGPDDIFFATSWWSAQAIKDTTIRKRFFYIIQEVETFFYNYGSERVYCDAIMHDKDIDFIVNSHYLNDYFVNNCENIAKHSCYFEPAFPKALYDKKNFSTKKEKYKLFFYARPNNPRNLYGIGVEYLQKAVDNGILNLDEWDVYCVGQSAPLINFTSGRTSINLGQLSWQEYAKFLSDIDLGLCLMYTPHPSYPPFDVASSGGVVLTNKMLNKQTFPMCDNVIMADLDEESFMNAFSEAVELAKNVEQRKKNFESNTIPHDWNATLDGVMKFMGEACENV